MTIADFNIVGDYHTEIALDWDSQETTNLYVAYDPSGRKKLALLNTPGIGNKTSSGSGSDNVRVLHVINDLMFCISGATVDYFNTGLTKTNVGSLTTASGAIGVASNNDYILFCDGSAARAWKTDGTWTTSITNFENTIQSVTFFGNVFVGVKPDTNQFFISDEGDATSWDPNNFALVPRGVLQACTNINGRLLLITNNAVQFWYDAGAADFPFRPVAGALYSYGTPAWQTVQSSPYDGGADIAIWLSETSNGGLCVCATTGGAPAPISTHPIEKEFQSYTTISDAKAFMFETDGHLFYQLTFPTENVTWLYDVTMKMWTKLVRNVVNRDHHIANCHAFFNRKHYIGSRLSEDIYEYSSNFVTEDGAYIYRSRTCAHFGVPGNQYIGIAELGIQARTGFYNEDNLGVDPKLSLRVSKDNGYIFSDAQLQSLGKYGNYGQLIRFNNLGSSRDFVFKLEIFDPVKICLFGGYLDFKVNTRT